MHLQLVSFSFLLESGLSRIKIASAHKEEKKMSANLDIDNLASKCGRQTKSNQLQCVLNVRNEGETASLDRTDTTFILQFGVVVIILVKSFTLCTRLWV